jgi:nickel-dependent lactate racemase
MKLSTANGKMRTLKVPYQALEDRDMFLSLDVDQKNLVETFIPTEQPPLADLTERLAEAVENPIGGKKLSELLGRGKKVTIITENQFRQAPANQVIQWLLAEIRKAGATPTIVIACGKMAVLSPEAIEEKLGREVVRSGVEICCNDVKKSENYLFKGITSFGVAVWVHRKVAEADTIITVSTTQATLWGYGGSGMIVPGVAGNDTVEYNHVMSLTPDCRPGNNNCRMQQDKYEAARIAGVAMGINMIVNNKLETTYINAGDFVESHREAIKAYDSVYRFDAGKFKSRKADIVVTGSSAAVGNLFVHTGWAIVNCLPILKEGGTIVFASPCYGERNLPGFFHLDFMKPYLPGTPESHERALKSFYDKSNALWNGCVWYKIFAAMLHADVRIVTLARNHELARGIGFNVYGNIANAYRDAMSKHGGDARVAFVPYGRYTILQV